MSMRLLFLSALAAAIAGCATSVQLPREAIEFQTQMRSRRPQEVRVVSDPPGAVIEIENDVKGRTPCTTTLLALPNGNLLGGVSIKAIPTRPGDYVQTKLLRGSQPLPRTLFFNMALGPPTKVIDVNLY